MGIDGHKKGSNFEREVSTSLSLWVSDGEDKFIFSRRQGSGGSFRDKQGLSNSGGDIYSDKRAGMDLMEHIVLELKFYKSLTNQFWDFVITDSSSLIIDKFIEQAKESALPYNRCWGLIIKCNHKKPIFITDSKILGTFMKNSVVKQYKKQKIYIFSLDSMLRSEYKKIKFQ